MIHFIEYADFTEMQDSHDWVSSRISRNEIIVIRQGVSAHYVALCKAYLTRVMSSTIPEYLPLDIGTRNFYRVNFEDERAYVKAFMHQFNFFSWNQDSLELFDHLGFLFLIREKSISREVIDYCGTVKRIAFQFYPAGRGYMAAHQDPVGQHQQAVLSLVMSKKGQDFISGGFYVEVDGEKVFPEASCDVGDVVLFNGSLVHGVETVDPDASYDALGTTGRWMALAAVTKTSQNNHIPNARQVRE